MKTRSFLLLILLLLLMPAFRRSPERPTTVVFAYAHYETVVCTDTMYIPYQWIELSDINDTLRKYLENGESVRSMVIAQPTLVVDSVDFTLFPELRELFLVGDPDGLEDRRYNFMDAPKLRKIKAYQMYVLDSLNPMDFTERGPARFEELIHKYRPDVKVRFKNNFHDTALYRIL